MRAKAGFSLSAKVADDLDALAFVRHEAKSRIVERSVTREIDGLAPAERAAFEQARAAAGARV